MRRKWIRRAAFGLLTLLLICAIGVALERASTRTRGERERDEAVARLDASDPGWRLADIHAARDAKLPPPDQNCGEQMLAVRGLQPPGYREWWQATRFPGEVSNHLPDLAEAWRAVAMHGRCRDALAAAHRAVALPRGGFHLEIAEPCPIDTLYERTFRMREDSSLLRLDANVMALNRRPAEALSACRGMLNLASGAIGDEPTIFSQMTRHTLTVVPVLIAEQTLAWNEVPDGLAETQARLAAERDVPRLVYAVRGERAMMCRLLENVEAGRLSLNSPDGKPPTGTRDQIDDWLLRRVTPHAQAYLLDRFTPYAEATKLPDFERAAALEALRAELSVSEAAYRNGGPRPSHGEILTDATMASFPKLFAAENRVRARLGCAVTAIACERFRQRHGRWPVALAEIPPDILAAVPADPGTGGPLTLRLTEDGAVVESTVPASKEGDGPERVRFRLWNPALRRAAPLPQPEE